MSNQVVSIQDQSRTSSGGQSAQQFSTVQQAQPFGGKKLIEELRKSAPPSNDVTPEIQEMLNKPIKLPENEKRDEKDYTFLEDIMKKVDEKKIELYRPASLLNMEVYEKLSSEGKAKADFDILNLLNKIREIRKLWVANEKDTYQVLYLIHALRLTKERLEELGGDLFII